METLFVKDLMRMAKGIGIDAEFMVKNVDFRLQNGGGGFLKFDLIDNSGTIGAIWWNQDEAAFWALQDIRYGQVRGNVNDYNGKRGLIVTSITDLGIPDDLSKFEAVAALPLAELCRRLDGHIASVRNPHLAALLELIFCDPDLRRKFEESPAAMKNHHACRHGLLQHTVEVTDLAVSIAERQTTWGYERPVERDLVVAGALLHDIGKIRELTWGDEGNGYTWRGNLRGHISLGTQLVGGRIAQVSGFPSVLSHVLLHIIESHHGKGEWGSPVMPMLPEAEIIHTADLLDAHLFYMQEAAAGASTKFVTVKNLENRRMFVRLEPIVPIHDIVTETVPATGYQVLVTGSQSPLPVLRFATANGSRLDTTFETRRLPLLGSVAAGTPLAAEQSIEDHFDVEAVGLPTDPQTYLLRVRGESMAGDEIHDGDIVVVRPQENHEPEDIVVALLRGDNEAAIKRVDWRDGAVFLVSSNLEFAPIPILDPGDLAVRGRVVARLSREEI